MTIQELIPLGPKTTMKIGGKARWFAELKTKEDVEDAWKFSREKNVPLLVLGGGANTVFADGTIEALVVKVISDNIAIKGNDVTAAAGCILATLLNRCAEANLDLSALTGIPGTLGGALMGNAGQGPQGVWLDSFVVSVTALVNGQWQTFAREECNFRYRESGFKTMPDVILWEARLSLPSRPTAEVKEAINLALKKRLEIQPYRFTAGSCFKAVDGTPAWKLIDKAGLRGFHVGGVQISDRHANFLINTGTGTFVDLLQLIAATREKVPQLQGIEMRLVGENGKVISA